MIKRKAMLRLQSWKEESSGTTSLLIEGARRVGKSTLVEEFARTHYKSHLIIDFTSAPKAILNHFEDSRDDVDSFLSYLEAYYSVKFHRRDTLIVFDEVQHFPIARAFLKQLVADGRYDYIATGSLISIKRNVEGILIPSEEESFELNPLDYEEFLLALGHETLVDILASSAKDMKSLPDLIHKKASKLFREYIIVGGMPQSVAEYIKSGDFAKVDKVKRRILSLYRNDIARYAQGYESKVVSIFEEIPSQLSKKEKRFFLSSLGKDARMRSYEDAFFWLADAKIANLCYNATDPSVGLRLSKQHTTLKCFLLDTGLLVSQAFDSNTSAANTFHKDILLDRLEVNEGIFMENYVAQALHAMNYPLYFYSRSDRNNSENTMEIDFLIVRADGPRLKVCPIEVKSGKSYVTKSLDKFRRKFSNRIGTDFILHTGNIAVEDKRVKLPLYLLNWLR